MGKPNYEGSYSLGRQPAASLQSQGVTFATIEREVAALRPDLTADELRRPVLLFALLKVGKAISKLTLFTKWSVEEIADLMATIDDPNLQYGSTVSARYVLRQVPGSEELIEAITGERIVAEEKPLAAAAPHAWEKNLVRPPISRVVRVASVPITPVQPIKPITEERLMNTETAVNGAAEAGELKPAGICAKTAECDRPAGHNGICKGQKIHHGPPVRTEKPKRRAAAVRAVKPARKARRPRPAVEPVTATAARAGGGLLKIAYEDDQTSFNYETIGREQCISALRSALQSLTGERNG